MTDKITLNGLFYKNTLPAMLALMFTGIYGIVDGFFVGNATGDVGLASIQLAYPLTALIQAIGAGVGMGGSILMSIARGNNNIKTEKDYTRNTLVFLLAACAVITAVLWFLSGTLLSLLGAKGDVFTCAKEYIDVIILGASFQILSTGLIPIMRNNGGALPAMLCLIAGFATNVVFDYTFIFVLGNGLMGAAQATIMGQAVSFILCLLYLLKKKFIPGFKGFKPSSKKAKEIFMLALSPFGLTFSPNIVLIILNLFALRYGGDTAITAYSITTYTTFIVQLLIQGIGDGCQPIISLYYGMDKKEDMRYIIKKCYIFALIVSVIGAAVLILLRDLFPVIFGASKEAAAISGEIMIILSVNFIGYALSRISTACFYAMAKTKHSYILVYGESVLLILLLTFVFPPILQLTGVWVSVLAADIILGIAGVVMYRKQIKKL